MTRNRFNKIFFIRYEKNSSLNFKSERNPRVATLCNTFCIKRNIFLSLGTEAQTQNFWFFDNLDLRSKKIRSINSACVKPLNYLIFIFLFILHIFIFTLKLKIKWISSIGIVKFSAILSFFLIQLFNSNANFTIIIIIPLL